MSHETFYVGEQVTWDEDNLPIKFLDLFPQFVMSKKYGKGPFKVIGTMRIPEGPYDDIDPIDYCGFIPSSNLRLQAGHHQWVMIEGKDGKLIGRVWSGSWFKKNTGTTL